MEALQFEKLKAALVKYLTAEQCVELEVVVKEIVARRLGETAIARKVKGMDDARRCPRCGYTDVVKHGRDKVVPRGSVAARDRSFSGQADI